MWMVVGLGNPGTRYEDTRHNVGWMIIDQMAKDMGASPFQNRFKAECATARFRGETVIFLKPQTFMNLSGDSVLPATSFYKVPLEQLIVIHDDIDLDLAQIKLKKGGGHGGHNGIRHISSRLGPEFLRVRAGVGRPQGKQGVSNFVLGRFQDQEEAQLKELIQNCIGATELIIKEDLKTAQGRYHTRPQKKKNKVKPPQES